ncbi:MAG: MTAP family purine nucleoside phosphorylase [Candidatus Micrarchaeota archaeon]
MLGIIGGSGLYNLIEGSEHTMKKHYGDTTVIVGQISDEQCAFIPRHGKSHQIPPHKINYLANIHALHELGVSDVLSICSVGIIRDYEPGDLVIVRDFIAFQSIPKTFFDDFSKGIMHADMTEPYSDEFVSLIQKTSENTGIQLKDGGILAHTSGPRFETKAEIKALGILGANIVGMTSVQEAILANELKMRFANIAIAANYASGISKRQLTVEEVIEVAKEKEEDIKKIITELVQLL